MNKKVDNEFKSIKDIYVLQCTCTEMKDILINIKNFIEENYTNKDGEIWHTGFNEIYDMVRKRKNILYNKKESDI